MDLLDQLATIARDHDSGGHAKIVSCFVRRNKILAYGFNSYVNSHPFQKKWARNKSSCFWHAETNLIFNCMKNQVDLTKGSMYICRIKKDKPRGKYVFGLAKPCAGCRACIKWHGIREIYYSTNEGYNYEQIFCE